MEMMNLFSNEECETVKDISSVFGKSESKIGNDNINVVGIIEFTKDTSYKIVRFMPRSSAKYTIPKGYRCAVFKNAATNYRFIKVTDCRNISSYTGRDWHDINTTARDFESNIIYNEYYCSDNELLLTRINAFNCSSRCYLRIEPI